MTERLITPPPQARMIAIPHEYLAICQRKKEHTITRGKRKGEKVTTYQKDEAAAALLYFFERWTIWRMKETNVTETTSIWLYFSMDQIEDYEFGGAFGIHKLNAAIELLMELGFIDRRNNPDKGYDRTYQYQFIKHAIQDAVNNLAPFFNIEEWKIQKRKMQSSKTKNAKTENEEAIQHDPKHDPEQSPSKQDHSGATAPEGKPQSDPVEPLEPTHDPETAPDGTPEPALDPIKEQAKGEKSLTPHQAMFQAVCDALDYDTSTLTPTNNKTIGQIASELRAGGAKPENVKPFWVWLQAKAQSEGWKSKPSKHAMKTYWPEYAKTIRPVKVLHVPVPGWMKQAGIAGQGEIDNDRAG